VPELIDRWLGAQLATVPDYHEFPGVDATAAAFAEIAAAHPRVARLARVGTSRLGEPIESLVVGDGARHAIVFAFPHPNEPIGGLTATHLARQLCADAALCGSFDLTWHVIGCADPDGARLNEGWFGGPFTRTHYARNFYRPAGDEQIEWTFPFQHKTAYFDAVLPETAALVRLIDRLRPAFMCSLHNSELGGAYYYLSRPLAELYPVLQAIPTALGVPLHRGEAEGPSIKTLAAGVFAEMRADEIYDYQESLGQDMSAFRSGASSSEYASRYGTVTLIGELPYWTDAAADDTSPAPISHAQALRDQADGLADFLDVAGAALAATRADLRVGTPFASPFTRAASYFIDALADLPAANRRRADAPEAQRPATVAEAASCADVVHSFRLRYGGMLLRALDGELAVGRGTPAIRAQHARLAAVFDDWCAAAAAVTPAEPLPIRSLVATQYAALLATARQVAGREAAGR